MHVCMHVFMYACLYALVFSMLVLLSWFATKPGSKVVL